EEIRYLEPVTVPVAPRNVIFMHHPDCRKQSAFYPAFMAGSRRAAMELRSQPLLERALIYPPQQQENTMQDIHQAILGIALLASFADGRKAEAEREQIRKIMESLQSRENEFDLAQLYQDVLLKRTDLAAATSRIREH